MDNYKRCRLFMFARTVRRFVLIRFSLARHYNSRNAQWVVTNTFANGFICFFGDLPKRNNIDHHSTTVFPHTNQFKPNNFDYKSGTFSDRNNERQEINIRMHPHASDLVNQFFNQSAIRWPVFLPDTHRRGRHSRSIVFDRGAAFLCGRHQNRTRSTDTLELYW